MTVLELLDSPDKWTKGELARDVHGNALTDSNSPAAISWCLLGAAQKCYGYNFDVYNRLRHSVGKLFPMFWQDIVRFNNCPETTFDDVRRVLEDAGV